MATLGTTFAQIVNNTAKAMVRHQIDEMVRSAEMWENHRRLTIDRLRMNHDRFVLVFEGGPLDGKRLRQKELVGYEYRAAVSLPRCRVATATYRYSTWSKANKIRCFFSGLTGKGGKRLRKDGSIWPKKRRRKAA